MKKTLLTFAFCLLILCTLSAAKKLEGYILYKNHKEKVTFLIPCGLFGIEPTYTKLQEHVRYLKENEKILLRPGEVMGISFMYKGKEITMLSVNDNLQMRTTFGADSQMFLKLEIDGVLKLFTYYFTSYSPGTYNPGTGMTTGGSSYTNDRYVLQKNNGELMRPRGLFFKKDMSEFLADCPELVDKIEARLLKKSDLEVIVKEYNTKCN